MDSVKRQLLRNPDIQPTSEVIAEALGEANGAYVKFLNGLASHDIKLEWRYYTDGKAWLAKGLYNRTGARGGQKEITVFWLSLWDGFFKVTVYLPETARAQVLMLPLDDEVMQMIADSKPMGKTMRNFPLSFELRTDELLEAVYTLADFRKSIK